MLLMYLESSYIIFPISLNCGFFFIYSVLACVSQHFSLLFFRYHSNLFQCCTYYPNICRAMRRMILSLQLNCWSIAVTVVRDSSILVPVLVVYAGCSMSIQLSISFCSPFSDSLFRKTWLRSSILLVTFLGLSQRFRVYVIIVLRCRPAFCFSGLFSLY